MRIRVNAHYDPQSKTYWAESPDLDGLTVSGETLDELRSETLGAAEVLLELAVRGHPLGKAVTELRVMDAVTCAA